MEQIMDIQIDEQVLPATPEQIADIEAERESLAQAQAEAEAETQALVVKLMDFGFTEAEAKRIASAS
jgi:ribosomal protein L9